jgi:hypothetical protein
MKQKKHKNESVGKNTGSFSFLHSFRVLVFKKKKKNQKSSSQPLPHAATPDLELGGSSTAGSATPRRRNSKEKTNVVGSPCTGRRRRTAWTQSWSGMAAPRGYPRSMGRPCGHPRGLGVAFGPTLDPSRAGPMATLGLAWPPPTTGGWPRGYPRGLGLARTWGWPSGQPFRRPGGRRSVGGAAFGGVFRLGSWRRVPAWAMLAAGPLRALVLAWLVFRPGRWQLVRGLA